MVAFFVSDMEWSGNQQLSFLLQSVILGAMQGVLLDVVFACTLTQKRVKRFLIDSLVGIPCALITFFGALVIMDGQLHPMLLFGVLFGMAAEHFTLGALLRKLVGLLRRGWRYCRKTGRERFHWISGSIHRIWLHFRNGRLNLSKNSEKSWKLRSFFRKKA